MTDISSSHIYVNNHLIDVRDAATNFTMLELIERQLSIARECSKDSGAMYPLAQLKWLEMISARKYTTSC